MLRGRLGIAVLLALVTLVAQAGEVKVHQWPAEWHYVKQEITTVPVVMDIGYWVEIVNQDDVLKLQQVSIHDYEGVLDLEVKCNFELTLFADIAPTGTVPGVYSCGFANPDVDPPGGIVTLGAKLENASLGTVPGGTENVHVASITISVIPRY
jgi:hypothetical protein